MSKTKQEVTRIKLASIAIKPFGHVNAIYGLTAGNQKLEDAKLITHCQNRDTNDFSQRLPNRLRHAPSRITDIVQGTELKSCFLTVVNLESRKKTIFTLPRSGRAIMRELKEAGLLDLPDALSSNLRTPKMAKAKLESWKKIQKQSTEQSSFFAKVFSR